MVTGSISLFYNQCHGTSDGKFCETPGPGASGGDWPKQEGREFGLVDGGKPGVLEGSPYQKAYEITAADGTKLQAYIFAGEDNPKAIRQTLNTMAAQHEMYPSSPPRRALILDDNISRDYNGPNGAAVGAWTYNVAGYKHNILINADNLYTNRFTDVVRNPKYKDYFMPKAQDTDPSHYLVTHEAGHQYDFMEGRNSAKPLYKNKAIRKHISKYGNSMKEEAYAEAFAEWHTSKGKTPNPAARAYAQHEGWFGTDGYKKPSLRGSGMVQLQDEPKETPDLGKLIPKNGDKIADTFDPEVKPIVTGDLPDKTVSSSEQEKADKLVDEIFRSMGYDAGGDKLKYSSTGQITLHLIGQHDQSTHNELIEEIEELNKTENNSTGKIELKVQEPVDLRQKAIELGIIRD